MCKKNFLYIFLVLLIFVFSGFSVFAVSLGDLDDNGVIDSLDYILLQRYLIGTNINIPVNLADLNRDGSVNSSDYILLRRYILGIINEFSSDPVSKAVRIMPLGDSITDGLTVEGGYRIKLWRHIQDNGYNIDFVGSQSNGPVELGDKDHEGHSGWKIAQIDAEINKWMDAAKPDIVLLHIGTNDIAFNDNTVNAGKRLSALIDKICAKLPEGGKLYVAKIIPLSFGNLSNYNNQIIDVVNNKSEEAKPVYLVDMYNALTIADLADGVHPNINGYNKMADVWFDAICDDLSS